MRALSQPAQVRAGRADHEPTSDHNDDDNNDDNNNDNRVVTVAVGSRHAAECRR